MYPDQVMIYGTKQSHNITMYSPGDFQALPGRLDKESPDTVTTTEQKDILGHLFGTSGLVDPKSTQLGPRLSE